MPNSEAKTLKKHCKRLGLQSSYLGVGKCLGKHVWLHISALDDVIDLPFKDVILSVMDTQYCVVRLHNTSLAFQLSFCPYFDEQQEPVILGNKSYDIINGKALLRKTSLAQTTNYTIFHHKHLMVSPTYKGFCLRKSELWSEHWKSAVPKCRRISSSIGRINAWEAVKQHYLSPKSS
jgi:hypothetical protein|tara:strand:+ start:75466 stop:75996 length:531 start_codon:yes stop_codon:yes gene_type:complete